jgi:hypothetical protein
MHCATRTALTAALALAIAASTAAQVHAQPGAPPAGANAAPADCSVSGGGGAFNPNLAARGDMTAGAVLGGVVGAGAGGGRTYDRRQCDEHGAYWTYGDSWPYQIYHSVGPDPRAVEDAKRGCRLAPAAINDQEARWVSVCPDANGRYRIAP